MADYGILGAPARQSDVLLDNWFGGQSPQMQSYSEPWYRALPNALTDRIYGPNANAQQAAGVRHMVGPENPLNLPAQFSEGVDTARTGYQLGNSLMAGLGALQAGTSLPIPGIFAGPAAKTANHAALAQAQKMAASGAKREAIHAETGWFKGVDGKWKFEIDDSGARWNSVRAIEDGTGRLEDFMRHPEIYAAYPEMKEYPAQTTARGAYFDPSTNTVNIGGGTPNKTTSALHELQHGAQMVEGFAHGGGVRTDGLETYKGLAGEVESRAVERRAKLTPDQRAARPPWLDYDVPEAEQIVRFGGAAATNGGQPPGILGQ